MRKDASPTPSARGAVGSGLPSDPADPMLTNPSGRTPRRPVADPCR
ncbi:MAG: hypothetical protein JWM76_1826 [Pseudonocardiales bacterium]|nr:hypothetical protein [Pseudonocardiales bacterium]